MDTRYQEPLWGYAFELSDTNAYAYLNLKPTKGILSPDRRPPLDDPAPADSTYLQFRRPAKYFIPYSKNGKLCWSKARNIYNTQFAQTQEEATHEYNKLVNDAIEKLYKITRDLSENFIRPIDPTIAVSPMILSHIPDIRKDSNND